MFKKKLWKIAYAITIAEGWFPRGTFSDNEEGSPSFRNHNPGNIRESEFEITNTGQFSVFENDIVGYFALAHQLYLYATGKSRFVAPSDTIGKMLEVYASITPDTTIYENYVSTIEKVAGVSRTDTVGTIIE